MTGSTREDLIERYGDIADASSDDVLPIVEILHAGYASTRAPETVRQWFRDGRHAGQAGGSRGDWTDLALKPDRSMPRSVKKRRVRVNYRFALTFLAAAVVTTGIAIAAANLTNLGKPMNVVSTQAYFPLSGFHRIVEDPRQGNTPELVFIGAIGPTLGAINVERWPVVKALQQFGTLSGLRSVNPDCVTAHGGSASGSNICAGPPTFDFLHARFRSRYLAFHSRDILQYQGEKDRLLQKLTPSDQRLFDRYARFRGQPVCFTTTPHYRTYACNGYIHTVEMTVYAVSGSRQLPLIAIGGYLQTVSQDLNPGDFGRAVTSTPNPSNPNGSQPTGYVEHTYTFNDVQRALITEHDPDPASHLVEDVNAEANIITALICHADGKKPASVCSRPAIRSILKHVK